MTEGELVITHLLGCTRPQLYLQRGERLGRAKSSALAKVLSRRIKGEPLAYILGETEFMGHTFLVNPDVLIPRPETELLVERSIALAQTAHKRNADFSVLDIGTGSGCIAISLAKALPWARVTAVEISERALAVARMNARLLGANVDFIQSDMAQACTAGRMHFDCIISNPPYIGSAEIPKLQREIHQEPRLALDAGEDGLYFYRRLIDECPACLNRGGFLLMEIGSLQKEAVKNIIQKSAKFEIIEVIKDYCGIERIMVCERAK